MDTSVRLPIASQAIAPDGMEVRLLASTPHGSMAHFRLAAGSAGGAISHDVIDELWFCLAGRGEMWLSQTGDIDEPPMQLEAGVSFSIPVGASFQLRNTGTGDLDVVVTTMPPWPGDHVAHHVIGPFTAPPERRPEPRQ